MNSTAKRPPAVAGRFYEADPAHLADDAAKLTAAPADVALPQRLVGAVVPHAGWICSGRVAGLAWRALVERSEARTIFLTGSVHTVELTQPALDTADAWQTPMGDVAVDGELRDAIGQLDGFGTFDAAHHGEHALEVQLPMLLHCFGPDVRIVPCMIPPVDGAVAWGGRLGELLAGWPEPVLVVASSDLTHHGPRFGYAPHGTSEAGYRWAHRVNDRQIVERIVRLDARGSLMHAGEWRSACGGGAIAAVIEAARRLGAEQGYTLAQTDSARELEPLGHGDRTNSVGYAAVVFG